MQVTEVAPPMARASAMALLALVYFLGQAVGVVIFGLGLETIGAVGACLLMGALILSVGLIAAFLPAKKS